MKSLSALFSELPSFSAISPQVAFDICNEELFAKYARPIFGSNHFPIAMVTSGWEGNQTELGAIIRHLCDVRSQLSRTDCLLWNSALEERGIAPFVPKNLEGSCVKELFPKGVCKASPDKWSCMGCGKSYVPGSYMTASCKKHPDPLWAIPLSKEIEELIAQHGVSNKAPIVWANSEGARLFVPKADRE